MSKGAGDPAGEVFDVPRLNPWPDALFEIGHDLGGDATVNVLTVCVVHLIFSSINIFSSETLGRF
jgi:hypothetical protein